MCPWRDGPTVLHRRRSARYRVPLAAVALCLGAAALLEAQLVFRAGVELAHFEVVVLDRQGTLVTGLTAADFAIEEDGVRQTIAYFAAGEQDPGALPLPLHVGLLLDTSGSMARDLDVAQTAAIRFLMTLPEAAEITLVDFDTEVRVARYGQASFPQLVERIRQREAGGWTALYDALGVYLDGAFAQDGRKVLIMYTDGGDTRSVLSFAETLDLLRASEVTVYAVGFMEHQASSVRFEQRSRLQRMAEVTGGRAFFPTRAGQLEEIFEQIRDELFSRYTMGYVSRNAATDGSWRSVQIRLTDPEHRGLRLRTRSGYFAPYREDSRP